MFELQQTNAERKKPTYSRGKRFCHCNEQLFHKHNREFRSKEGWWLSLNPLDSENISDILEKYKHHPSIYKISQTFMTNEKFSFQFVTEVK